MTPVCHTKMFGGVQSIYVHRSAACDSDMRVAVYAPPQAKNGPCAALVWLSGLTCTEENFIQKAGAQRLAAELGLVLIAPDTSPRGDAVPDDEAYDFGQGAGFYLNATKQPWAKHFQMQSYIRDELISWATQHLPVDPKRFGISGHSMGGHGALTLHLKNPGVFKSCSAFAPVSAPMQTPWGQKAFAGYLGADQSLWARYDASALVAACPSGATLLIDQGTEDDFLAEQLRPEIFQAACQQAGQSLTLRMQDGYDHSYYFIASFIEDHLRHHSAALSAQNQEC